MKTMVPHPYLIIAVTRLTCADPLTHRGDHHGLVVTAHIVDSVWAGPGLRSHTLAQLRPPEAPGDTGPGHAAHTDPHTQVRQKIVRVGRLSASPGRVQDEPLALGTRPLTPAVNIL